MKQKFLGISSLALLQIVIVGNLQPLPANALYGFSLPFLYLCAAIGFFIPCVLMTAELATTHPQTGGAYIWSEKAFGAKLGFFTVAILWFSNVLWYPSIFSLLAVNAAYLINPALAQNKIFVISFALISFWLITGLNCAGIKISSRTSVICAVVGIILPMVIIIVGGISWWLSGQPLAISLNQTPLIPNLKHLTNLGFLIAIVISLAGIELPAVHAGNVINPKRDYTISLLISGILLLALLLGAELSIAIIVPTAKLSVISGLLDALKLFFQSAHWPYLIGIILLLVFLGNLGSITAWMLGSTRGMSVACERNHLTNFLQKKNRQQAPVGILIFEALIFTISCGVFLLFPHITDSFWLLLDVGSQISLIYYIILFCSAIRLRYLPKEADGFIVPGGNFILWGIMGLAILTSVIAIILGFIPPPDLTKSQIFSFHFVMVTGLIFAFILPLIFLKFKESN